MWPSPTSSTTTVLTLSLLVLTLLTGRHTVTAAAAVYTDNEMSGNSSSSNKNSNDRMTCSEALHSFLSNLSRTYSSEDNSLVVQGSPLEEDDDFPAVCGTDTYSLELWRAITVPGASLPPDFGTREYFSKYQNCDNPNPDLLWKHGDSVRATVGGGVGRGRVGGQSLRLKGLWPLTSSASSSSSTAATMDKVVFYHVVEQQYILRICPCNNSAPLVMPCSCDHLHHLNGGGGGGSATTCSEIFNISNPYREKVFPWCRGDGTPAPRPQLSAPKLQHCPAQVMLSGTLPSCTPVRDYDKVEVVLQPMAYEVEDCKELPREATGRLAKQAPLTAINDTHGMFHVAIGNITHETYYCLRVELGRCIFLNVFLSILHYQYRHLILYHIAQ